MKKGLFIIPFSLLTIFLPGSLLSQPVTIGTTLPARAVLEVHGAGGPGGTGYTSGILGGDGAGISLQRWPAIGFNQYIDNVSRFMANGYAAFQNLDPVTGEFAIDMMGSGNANVSNTYQIRALTIGNNGNVGLRTVASNASLYAVKGPNFSGSAIFAGTLYSSFFHYSDAEDIYINPGNIGGNVYINNGPVGAIIMGDGNCRVGINSSAPAFSLEVRQVGQLGILLTEPGQSNNHWEQALGSYGGGPQSSYNYYYNGELKCYLRPTDGVLIVASDRRIKTNITPMAPVLDKILQLNPVTFEMKYNNPDRNISWGFIAQEVQKIFPEMVTVSSQEVEKGLTIPDFHALDYNTFKIIAVKGVQEEQKILQKQQDILDDINKRLEVIQRKLQSKKFIPE